MEKLTNQSLINSIEELLNSLVEVAFNLDERNCNAIEKLSLADKEYDKFIERIVKFYGEMHASMVLLKNEHVGNPD